ncbi:MAG: NADH-quinone oxidoreductase subunit K [Planctomycetota bacterium]
MTNWLDTIMVLLALTNLVMLSSSRLAVLIRMAAIQGVLLGSLPFLTGNSALIAHQWLLATCALVLKALVFPYLLSRARERANVRREVEPFVSYTLSLGGGMAALIFSLWLGARLPVPLTSGSTLLVPLALFTFLVGLFLIITRKQALTQVLGYLAMENGIYAFSLALAIETPLLVELGVLLDIFVAVFLMGIVIFHISREFNHIDTDRLSSLKG